MKKMYKACLIMLSSVSLYIFPESCDPWDIACHIRNLGSTLKEEVIDPTGEFFQEQVYEKGLRDIIYEQGIKFGVDGIVDAANITGEWVNDSVRAVDYGIRKAALETSLAIATASLRTSEEIATGPLQAAYEIASASLLAAEKILEGLKNASAGIVAGSAEASKGLLEGVKQGTNWTIKQGEIILTRGPLSWIDLNEITYRGSYKELKDGVLGNVVIKAELFHDPVIIEHVTIDTKQDIVTLTAYLVKTIAEPLASSLADTLFNPVTQAVQQANTTIDPLYMALQEKELLVTQLDATTLETAQATQVVQQQVVLLDQNNQETKAEIAATLATAQEEAAHKLQEAHATAQETDGL